MTMFPTFPDFAPLTLDDKQIYDELIAEYPPFSNISFSGLHIWWNLEGKLSVSTLNGNLIINYYQRFDIKNSGFSIIGRHQLEDSIQTIFTYLEDRHEPVKLVHVPEFVIKQLKEQASYSIEEELDYNEYILDSKALASLEGRDHGRTRRKVNRFLREVEGRKVEIKQLDLASQEVKAELFDAIMAWEKAQPSANDPEHTEHNALAKTLTHASLLNVQYLGLYIDDKLYAIVLYNQPTDSNYYILNHLKVDYSIPYIFDYMTHAIAKKADDDGVAFLNMEMDLGIESLRRHKMGLRPVEFFRQYTVEPLRPGPEL